MEKQLQAINTFIKKLVEEKQIKNIDEETRAQIESDLYDRIEDRINVAILENLPAEKLDEFNDLLDSGNLEEIQKYCHDNINDFEEMIARELISFRNIYLNI